MLQNFGCSWTHLRNGEFTCHFENDRKMIASLEPYGKRSIDFVLNSPEGTKNSIQTLYITCSRKRI